MNRPRNFTFVADIDGQCTQYKGGPRSKDGGMTITIYQNKGGEQVRSLVIECKKLPDGTLVTSSHPVQHLIAENDEHGRAWIETHPADPQARQVQLPEADL